MFWGLVLKANKKYSQTVQKAFHLSQAALDLSKCGDADVQVMLTSEESTYLLCTLGKKTPQVALDLNFDEGDQISLSTKGDGVVHLTGYLLPNTADLFSDEEEEEEEDEKVEDSPAKGKSKERIAKKVALKVNAKEVQNDDDDEDELDETFELPKGAEKKSGAKGEEDEDDSDDDDDEDDEDDDEDDDDEMGDAKNDGEDDSEDDDDEDEDDDDDDEDDSEDEQPKAKVAKVEKKASKQNGLENGKASPKEQKKEGQQQSDSKTRTLQGGLVVEDLKVGSGAEAKPGKKAVVYYEGRLKKNNKVFDSTSKGPGFKFTVGRGEVIKGWDLGVSGMKVGGKRRLTVPHQLAYGTRGSPPVIPPNSTLVFDVELKNVF